MTEKEFLENALGVILNYNSDEEWLSKKIDDFLEYHHKEYFEVEFVKIEDEEIYAKRIPPVEFTLEQIRDTYNEVMKTIKYEKGKELPDPRPSEPEPPLEFKGVPIVWDKD